MYPGLPLVPLLHALHADQLLGPRHRHNVVEDPDYVLGIQLLHVLVTYKKMCYNIELSFDIIQFIKISPHPTPFRGIVYV